MQTYLLFAFSFFFKVLKCETKYAEAIFCDNFRRSIVVETHPEFTSMAVIGNPAIFYINHKRKNRTNKRKTRLASSLIEYLTWVWGFGWLFSRGSEWGFGCEIHLWSWSNNGVPTTNCTGFPYIDCRS